MEAMETNGSWRVVGGALTRGGASSRLELGAGDQSGMGFFSSCAKPEQTVQGWLIREMTRRARYLVTLPPCGRLAASRVLDICTDMCGVIVVS
jgi:hypothetical protein